MTDTKYAPGPIKSREWGEELKTTEKGYLQSTSYNDRSDEHSLQN